MDNIATKLKKHRLYKDYVAVKATLAQHQFVCWIAGGAVRDFYIGREVHEFDLVTDATTEVLKELFPNAVLVGESFGVIKLPIGNAEFFDLATFRQESDYLDGRRPNLVNSSTPYKDSERRDFTINAMFWDDERQLIVDYRNGLSDMSAGVMSCVGNAEVRFNEDHLRILRLVRFSAQMRFKIEPATYAAATKLLKKIKLISGERVWDELKKINKIESWEFISEESLFCELLKEILDSDSLNFESLKRINFKNITESSWVLFVIIYILSPETDFLAILKKRLKVSNLEAQKYSAIRFLMAQVQQRPLAELAYEVENSALNRETLHLLSDARLIQNSLVKEVEGSINLHAEALVKAQDLLSLVPNHVISTELKHIRISQFNEVYKTKAEVLDYLKKKYANIGEKP
ncbi:MAG: CCA tRNA nucleotidyltransferase [Pseudobdellovibrio sp.]